MTAVLNIAILGGYVIGCYALYGVTSWFFTKHEAKIDKHFTSLLKKF